ncbi:MAG: hypothetical protein IPK75_20230 [Acidobacteria bacterium]|nr:hypothetical protein [Acidobacteriota bacterium]
MDTNLKQAGRLPDPKHFFVTALRFLFSARNKLTDIARLNDNFYVEFEIGDKIYAEGHVDLYPSGAGIYGTSTKSDESAYTNGVADPNAVNLWGVDRGIHILQGQISRCVCAVRRSPRQRCGLDGSEHPLRARRNSLSRGPVTNSMGGPGRRYGAGLLSWL